MKYSLSYGLNVYPNPVNDLQGCVNDALGWADILTNLYGFQNKLLLNQDATRFAVYNSIEQMIANSVAGDSLVITGSSHGTSIPDSNGDEIDGKDEAVCLYDGIILDDTFSGLFLKLPDNVSLTVILDSCYSGTGTREFNSDDIYRNPRYMNYETVRGLFDFLHPCIPSIPIIGKTEEDMKEILISGCNDKQYSYDADIDGVKQGAFSFYGQKVIRQKPNQTYSQFIKRYFSETERL